MFEAIGLAEHGTYFCRDRSAPHTGRARLPADDRRARLALRALPATPDWIQQTIFPGSLLPSLEAIAKSVGRTRLQINGVEEIGFGYARTLREWRENVTRNIERIGSLGYDERFLRTWSFYLCYCEAGFAIRSLRDMQIVLSHTANDALPTFPPVRPGY